MSRSRWTSWLQKSERLPVTLKKRPLLVTFSGIDGSGKSTNIATLRAWLLESGLRVRVVTFWDDVVVLPRLRQNVTSRLFKGEIGVGRPDKPVQRRDKNLSPWYATLGRCGFYVLDAIHQRWVVKKLLNSDADVVIFDRYFYDQLAILPIEHEAARIYARLLFKLVPQPDIAYLLDADPEAAFLRKPEYPLEFLKKYRRSYLLVRDLMDSITLIPPVPLDKAHQKIVDEFMRVSRFPLEYASVLQLS